MVHQDVFEYSVNHESTYHALKDISIDKHRLPSGSSTNIQRNLDNTLVMAHHKSIFDLFSEEKLFKDT